MKNGLKGVLAIILCVMIMLAGCSKLSPSGAPELDPASTVDPSQPTIEPAQTKDPGEPEPEVTQPADDTVLIPGDEVPEGISPTTGLPESRDYTPIFVSIGNTETARPYWNAADADIVYEILMEGQAITRFVALFNDKIPAIVGSVRSARVIHANIISEWKDAVLMFSGGDKKAGDASPFTRLKQYDVEAHEATGKYAEYFTRRSERKAPHNLVVHLEKYVSKMKTNTNRDVHFRFSNTPTEGTESGTKVSVTFTKKLKNPSATYVYDESTGNYKRYNGKSTPARDFDGDVIEVANVIIQHVPYKVIYPKDGKLDCGNIGEGKAEVFINGKMTHATWKRPMASARTVYYDENGDEIQFKPGKTWVSLVKDAGIIEYE